MFFGGSFEPAYVMSVSALPSQLLPTANKRNAALIQKHMEEALSVSPARGLLRFAPIQEEQFACNGRTVAAEIDQVERGSSQDAVEGERMPFPSAAEDGAGGASRGMHVKRMLSVKVNLANTFPCRLTLTASLQSLAALRLPSAADLHPPQRSPPSNTDEVWPSPVSHHKTRCRKEMERESPIPPQGKAAQKKKSFMAAILGRSGRKSSDRSSLPAVADI
jgi:hypothetical protein